MSSYADFAALATPAFVYDEAAIFRTLDLLAGVRTLTEARLLYSIKAFPFTSLLERILPRLDGFSASSLFEARLAAEVLQRGGSRDGSLHLTTPGLRPDEISELADLCDTIGFNSLEQFHRWRDRTGGRASPGIRINPRLSFLDDPRYDPCRPHSKLGVPVEALAEALAHEPALAARIEGIQFHTLFESRAIAPLRATLERIESALGPRMGGFRWINLGGGCLFETEAEIRELAAVVRELRNRHGLEVFIEPGKAIVGAAGYLVASVIDRFERDGKSIAVLDTGVPHLPEVFEYQKPPRVVAHRSDGPHATLLAGCTCLAGDVFGEYRFAEPLNLGDRVVFENVGAYSLVKASRFNGHDLPTIHARGIDGRIRRMKSYGYEDYRKQWTADARGLAGGDGAL